MISIWAVKSVVFFSLRETYKISKYSMWKAKCCLNLKTNVKEAGEIHILKTNTKDLKKKLQFQD